MGWPSDLNYRLFEDVNTFARRTSWLHSTLVDYAKYGIVVFSVLLRLGLLTWLAALLMAFARVYVGAHYPWDVIAACTFANGFPLSVSMPVWSAPSDEGIEGSGRFAGATCYRREVVAELLSYPRLT